MIKNMYVIKDVVAGEAATPIINCEKDELMIRELSDSKLTDVMEKHPEDFDVICIGTFDTVKCLVTPGERFISHLGALRNGKAC